MERKKSIKFGRMCAWRKRVRDFIYKKNAEASTRYVFCVEICTILPVISRKTKIQNCCRIFCKPPKLAKRFCLKQNVSWVCLKAKIWIFFLGIVLWSKRKVFAHFQRGHCDFLKVNILCRAPCQIHRFFGVGLTKIYLIDSTV